MFLTEIATQLGISERTVRTYSGKIRDFYFPGNPDEYYSVAFINGDRKQGIKPEYAILFQLLRDNKALPKELPTASPVVDAEVVSETGSELALYTEFKPETNVNTLMLSTFGDLSVATQVTDLTVAKQQVNTNVIAIHKALETIVGNESDSLKTLSYQSTMNALLEGRVQAVKDYQAATQNPTNPG